MAGTFAINRRVFCGGLGLAGLAPGGLQAAEASGTHGYVGESGKPGTWPLVVGLLTTDTPERHSIDIEMLRRRAGYPRALRYMSTDRGKIGFARSIIDYFAREPDLRFMAVVASGADGATRDDLRQAIYRRLAEETGVAMRRAGKDPSNLAQLARFLTGCVHGATAGVDHPMKRELIDRLAERIGLSAVSVGEAPTGGRFSVVLLCPEKSAG